MSGIFGTMKSVAGAQGCGCIGPQRGEPYCPCRMRGVIERDGRWIEPERDLGPVRRSVSEIDMIRNLPADFSDDGNCCVGKLADAHQKKPTP